MAILTTADLSVAVRERRLARGATQADLARLSGVSRGFLIRLEQGQPGLEISRVLAVLAALDLSVTLSETVRSPSRTASEKLLDSVFTALDGGDDHG